MGLNIEGVSSLGTSLSFETSYALTRLIIQVVAMSSENQEPQSTFNPYRTMMCDVYISGEPQNPPHPFISHLYVALKGSGVYVLGNHTEPNTNDLFLSGAIEGCRVSIIVFTTDYAKSTVCLQELVKIMECHRRNKVQKVVPVFYCLYPSEVSNQGGYFGKVLLDTLERNSTDESKVLSYRTALREASAISPKFLPDIWNERKVIENIVGHVTSLLDATDLFVAQNPVGVHSHVQDLIQLLSNQNEDGVLIMAIWGMAGIGKTTIAKALYNQISHNFEVKKFVPNIKDRIIKNSARTSPISSVEEELLLFFQERVTTKTHNADSTRDKWWGLPHIKVLLILDDVRSERELEVLPVTRECFGPGNIIIITKRIKHDRLHEIGVNHIYRVKEMNYNECVELFSWSTFNKATPERSFSGLINYAVEYSDGLPLTLVAIGFVLSEKIIEEWENVLDRIKRFPLQNVREILEENIYSVGVGYVEMEIFLELAYLSHLFIGMDRNDICQILKEAGHHDASRAIKGIEEHSLVWFDEDMLCMNRLLQDTGRAMYHKKGENSGAVDFK